MNNFERDYASLVSRVLVVGEKRVGRNGGTRSLFGESFSFDMSGDSSFPLLLGRKIFYKGVLGELAAMLRGPKSLDDFEKFGCNYWELWAKDDRTINVDYGNLWVDWNGVNQLANLIDKLKNNSMDRRMIINSWKPDTLDQLDLPCCHYSYQWYVREGVYLDMIWTQRSCDTMIGLPSDIILAATWNILIANQVGLQPGKIKMDLGDTHIYEEHVESALRYRDNVLNKGITGCLLPSYRLTAPLYMDCTKFEPHMLEVKNYAPIETISFELKA